MAFYALHLSLTRVTWLSQGLCPWGSLRNFEMKSFHPFHSCTHGQLHIQYIYLHREFVGSYFKNRLIAQFKERSKARAVPNTVHTYTYTHVSVLNSRFRFPRRRSSSLLSCTPPPFPFFLPRPIFYYSLLPIISLCCCIIIGLVASINSPRVLASALFSRPV